MDNSIQRARGREELRKARKESRGLYWFVAIFSFLVNLLMLTGPLYMLQVYDRVLGSRSEATLLALTAIVAFLYGMMGILDFTRGRIMARVGARFQAKLDKRVFDAAVRKSAVLPDERSATGLRDLESVQRLMTSPVLMSIFDMPWTPFFLFGIMIFHPWLGYLAISGGVILVFVAILNQISTRRPIAQSSHASMRSEAISDQIQSEAEMIQAMGMRRAAFDRWQTARNESLTSQLKTSDMGGMFSSITKTFRLFLQSAMLGLGAYLVLQNELTPGAMIAGSILMGRALAPIELAIGQWPLVQRARKGWDNLVTLLGEVPPEAQRTALPVPKARLEVQQASVIPPGDQQASLRVITFDLKPGQALGVIGPSGSGKSTLARAVTGVWRCAGGKIRLDGATLDQYDPERLGEYIGYLPQRVQLFEGTIADNIARLSGQPDAEKIVAAAKKAAAHEMILKLPDGYDTKISATGGRLSGGQIQRIGLARAMYSDPIILVLDEPNSNLDNEGSEALNQAIRVMKSEGKSVMIMAHRPSAIQECEMLLVLEGGTRAAFGPKDEVLRKMVQNHEQIRQASGGGGVR
ncbi:type I secretion system permease/ATPase [Mesobacterium pallidum]|uniref:type I secretion system permease/ATPase n=1 Tax=Mesobacterium pallidum TaxID=2872037 RepID=UPI001EE1564E|nr:type I secretion system permease/ATPase [Mesobacterium pallidum]